MRLQLLMATRVSDGGVEVMQNKAGPASGSSRRPSAAASGGAAALSCH